MVGIVVVTYNRLSLLKECIDALRHQTYKKFSYCYCKQWLYGWNL